ncbi:hypothetical protein ESCO_000605 [Escovopsis weberi]|uniref:Uncharacterized protein n=1 Tax=Escovopsis weberi TaxID=150374 RepID=A0A0M9VUA1_ESCWE|nr:hypothetical protein ESCO_000605 [Escovopsis weberi]
MTAPVLIPIAVSALCIAAAIEFLAQRSRIHGGLALVSTPDSISQYAMISYLYLPTVLAAIFSLVWNWVDLDVKRMQPWFELSKPGGATAENSLFLDYPYDFVGIVPFKAFKRSGVSFPSSVNLPPLARHVPS